MTNITSEEIKKCLEAVGRDEVIVLRNKILTDYELGDILSDYLQENRVFMKKTVACKVKSPYVMITDMFTSYERTQELAMLLGIPEDCITAVDYSLGYEYIINCGQFAGQQKVSTWEPREFLENMIQLGKYADESFIEVDEIVKLISQGLYYDEEDLMVAVEIEDSVLAIAVDTYIPDAKQRFSNILGISPTLLVEVSGPTSTVILIDAGKLYLLYTHEDVGVDAWLI